MTEEQKEALLLSREKKMKGRKVQWKDGSTGIIDCLSHEKDGEAYYSVKRSNGSFVVCKINTNGKKE